MGSWGRGGRGACRRRRATYARSLPPPTPTPTPTPYPPPRMQAVTAYLKSGDVKSAVDSCVRDHHWEVAVQLAETHNYPDIQKVVGARVTLTPALTLASTLTLAPA